MALQRMAMAMAFCWLAGCGPANNQYSQIFADTAPAYGVTGVGSSAVFFVNDALWADIHYHVNGGQQLNIRMTVQPNNGNQYTLNSLTAGTVIDYNFTYYDLSCQCAHDSPAAEYIQPGGVATADMSASGGGGGASGGGGSAGGGVAGGGGSAGGGTTTVDMAASPDLASTATGDMTVLPTGTPYPTPIITAGPTTGGSDQSATVVPLFDSTTVPEPPTVTDIGTAIVTTVGDRVRDRHAREAVFHIYEHFLPFYFVDRTHYIEIIDTVAKGGSTITINLHTIHPQDAPNVRAFFRGITTVAEYFYNADFTTVNDYLYTATITTNPKENRAIQIGDRMEIEVGIFLAAPFDDRFNYYSSVMLYVVGSGGIQPFIGEGSNNDSYPMDAIGLMGGATTLNYPYSNEPDLRFIQMATNMSPNNAQPWVEGRRLFHTNFLDGTHSEPGNPVFTDEMNKIGGNYVVQSCETCHVNNGRALPTAIGTTLTTTSVKVGNVSGGVVTPNAQLGTQVQPFNLTGSSEGTANINSYVTQNGTFADGTAYQLQRPIYSGSGAIPAYYSARITPQLVGLGLLEAVPESAIQAMVDVNDANGDGISGRMSVVTDRTTGQPRMGRFGWKAAQATLNDQIVTALNREMSVKSSGFATLDCGSAQTGCDNGAAPIEDAAVDELVRYVGLLGVPARRSYDDATALSGEQLFASAGCTGCHTPTLTTSAYAPKTELRSQTIHPYTDLLLHDMGVGLADNLPEGIASGAEWRTPPLWGIGLTAGVSGGEAYLHDGRARSLTEAILWHGGEGAKAQQAFVKMTATQRAALLAFLATI